MAKLEDLIKQIPDTKLRPEVACEVDVLEASLQFADPAWERGRQSAFEPREPVLTAVGDQYGE